MARRGEWLAVGLGHQVPVNEVVSSRVESCQVGPSHAALTLQRRRGSEHRAVCGRLRVCLEGSSGKVDADRMRLSHGRRRSRCGQGQRT